jgi:hypothetical protein
MDINDEFAALEATSLAALATAPAAAPSSLQQDPVPGTVAEVTVDLNNPLGNAPQLPTPPAAPTPVAPAAPVPAPAPAPPAPAQPPLNAGEASPQPPQTTANPPPVVPEEIERRYYMRGLSPEQQLAVAIMANNRDLSPVEAAQIAQQRLGQPAQLPPVAAPAPVAPAAEPAAPAQPQITYDTVNTRLDAITSELQALDPVLDSERWKELTLEERSLNRQLPVLLLQENARASQDAATAQVAIDQQIEASKAIAYDRFPDLKNPSSPLAQAYNAAFAHLVETDHPLTAAPNFEEVLAYQVAGDLGILPRTTLAAPAAVASPPAAAPAPGTASPQAPAPASPGHTPLTAMPAMSGTASTSADRVTTAPAPNPMDSLNAEYNQAVQAGDFSAMERLSGLMVTSAQPPAQSGMAPAFSISISGAAA